MKKGELDSSFLERLVKKGKIKTNQTGKNFREKKLKLSAYFVRLDRVKRTPRAAAPVDEKKKKLTAKSSTLRPQVERLIPSGLLQGRRGKGCDTSRKRTASSGVLLGIQFSHLILKGTLISDWPSLKRGASLEKEKEWIIRDAGVLIRKQRRRGRSIQVGEQIAFSITPEVVTHPWASGGIQR